MYRGLTEYTYRGRDHSKDAKIVEKFIFTLHKKQNKGTKELQNLVIKLQPPRFKEHGASKYIRREGREATASVAVS